MSVEAPVARWPCEDNRVQLHAAPNELVNLFGFLSYKNRCERYKLRSRAKFSTQGRGLTYAGTN